MQHIHLCCCLQFRIGNLLKQGRGNDLKCRPQWTREERTVTWMIQTSNKIQGLGFWWVGIVAFTVYSRNDDVCDWRRHRHVVITYLASSASSRSSEERGRQNGVMLMSRDGRTGA